MVESQDEAAIDETTTRVLDAAFAEFVELGIRRASVDGVARRAKLGRMTVYRRFAGKERLLQAVLMRESERFLASLASSVEAPKTVSGRLESGFVAAVLSWHRHPLREKLIEREPEAALPQLTYEAGPMLAAIVVVMKQQLALAEDLERVCPSSIDDACDAAIRLAQSFSLTPPWDGVLDADYLRRAARRLILPLLTARKTA